jgi:tellurite resistance protein
MTQADASLLGRVAKQLSRAPSYAESGVQGSILAVAATSYGSRPADEEEVTQPTGFDPEVAALFEAVVEGAYLVAHADNEFDPAEQQAFQHVVLSACGGKVLERQVEALLLVLEDSLKEDGIDKRCRMVARTVQKPEHAKEVLRIAALIAHVSGGVSDDERRVLDLLAREFKLDSADLEAALAEAGRVLEPDDGDV